MDIILVPGLWLDASSWDDVIPALETAGHSPHPLTMPGAGASVSESSAVGIADWVSAVVAKIDELAGDVVLVGHSGGGNVVYGAADARPDRVSRIVFVDTFPPGDGGSIWEFPIVDGVIPFPGWDAFEDGEIDDLDAPTRERFEAGAVSVPALVPTDPLHLGDERRRDVPATMISSTVPSAQVRELMAQAPAWIAELAAVRDLDIVDLPGGHWPQFSQPDALGAAIVRAVAA